jgi:hypothetical protein
LISNRQGIWLEGGGVPGKHGGGGPSQNDILKVDPDAVPALRGAFVDALAKVDRQLELADKELRVTAWAKDPVSMDATTRFNDRSVESVKSAVDTLRAYRTQLDTAVRTLDKTAEQYQVTDRENATGTTKHGEG